MSARAVACHLALLASLGLAPTLLRAQPEDRILPQLHLAHYPERPPAIPPDFTYAGQPIEAVCIQRLLADRRGRAPLDRCPRPVNVLDCPLSEKHDDDPWWDLRGYRGYCYVVREQGPAGTSDRQYNIVYKYLGKLDGHHAVLAESGAGTSSSGVRRHVMLLDVQRHPPALVLVKTFTSGSVIPVDARIDDGRLLSRASVQGSQLAELAGLDLGAMGVSPEDFPASGMMADTDVAEFQDGRLRRVWLLPHRARTNRPDATGGAQPRPSECFAQIHQRYLDEKRTELSPVALETFTKEVIACMKAARQDARPR